ncbi:MAG: response regulator [Candidatus Marinimicrobia bacterium]|nr:response regulator [Candidatus Neomarinimicrobiota bacterium]
MKKKVLIAEDDQISCEYLLEILKPEGFEIITARNGREAIKQCEEHPGIAAVLMDIKMPEMDGEKAVSEIKKLNPKIPVIAQTAYALDEERATILNAGFDDYLAKPIRKEDLLDTIRKHTGG